MEELPMEVLNAILVRVPLPDMLQSIPLVCKKWNHSTRCPSFIHAYQLHHGEWLITGCICQPDGPWRSYLSSMVLYLFNIRSSNSWYKLRFSGQLIGPTVNYCFSCFGAGPFFGLVKDMERSCIVGNPLTNQWCHLRLPFEGVSNLFLVPNNSSNSNFLCDYKLMAIESRIGPPRLGNAAQVYDFQTESWTMKAVSPLSILSLRVDYQATSGFVCCLKMESSVGKVDILLTRYDIHMDEWKSMVTSAPQELECGGHRGRLGIFPTVVQCSGELLVVGRISEKHRPSAQKRRRFSNYDVNVVGVWRLPRPNWGQGPGQEWELVGESPPELMNHIGTVSGEDFRVCSDEQSGSVWFFMPRSAFMLSFKFPSREWRLLPGVGEGGRGCFDHIACSNLSFGSSILPIDLL